MADKVSIDTLRLLDEAERGLGLSCTRESLCLDLTEIEGVPDKVSIPTELFDRVVYAKHSSHYREPNKVLWSDDKTVIVYIGSKAHPCAYVILDKADAVMLNDMNLLSKLYWFTRKGSRMGGIVAFSDGRYSPNTPLASVLEWWEPRHTTAINPTHQADWRRSAFRTLPYSTDGLRHGESIL